MKDFNFCIDENIPYAKEAIGNLGNSYILPGRKITNEFLVNNKINILFCRSQTKVNQNLCEDSDLKFIATATAGFDHFDINYLNNSNIPYFASPGCNAKSVAEYVVYGILKWALNRNVDLKNLKLGIVGYGNIGKILAKYGNWLGLKILVNDLPLKSKNYNFPEYCEYKELDDLIAESDIISNHVPLEKNSDNFPTYKLFNSNNLQFLKNEVLIIHALRGRVVDENALLEVIEKKNIISIIDVWEGEPNFNLELTKKSMIATPHIAGHSYNGKLNGTIQVLENFEKVFSIQTDKSIILKELDYYQPIEEQYYSDYHFMYDLIAKNRKIDEDDLKFKSLISLSLDERNKQFDLQRKNYPIRYEIL